MGTQVTAGAGWPEVGERDPNPRAHGRKIQSEINAVLERARAATGKGRSTAIPRAKIVPLLESVLDYIGKGPAEAQGGMHPQATTKDDLDAFAAKILAAVSVQPQWHPTVNPTVGTLKNDLYICCPHILSSGKGSQGEDEL
ncbi:hypothetical protein KCU95_g20397, partial [Aureobasidium melanogenum]